MSDVAIIDVPTTAALLGLSETRVGQLIRMGRLPATKLKRDYAILRADVEAFARLDRPVGRRVTKADVPQSEPEPHRPARPGEIPLYGAVPCGRPAPGPDGDAKVAKWVQVGVLFGSTDGLFIVTAAGTSMTAANIDDGDWVVIRAHRDPQPGQIVLASLAAARGGDDVTIKKLVTVDGERVLESCDGRKSRRVMRPDDVLVGYSVGVIRGAAT